MEYIGAAHLSYLRSIEDELPCGCVQCLNHPNLNGADNYMGDTTFGQLVRGQVALTGAANNLYATGGPRSLQLSFKLKV